jgi:hypothetical protein
MRAPRSFLVTVDILLTGGPFSKYYYVTEEAGKISFRECSVTSDFAEVQVLVVVTVTVPVA